MGDKVAVGVMEREGFSILESCLGRPISKNSGLEGLILIKNRTQLHSKVHWVNTCFT
jgi:hypothetical protein